MPLWRLNMGRTQNFLIPLASQPLYPTRSIDLRVGLVQVEPFLVIRDQMLARQSRRVTCWPSGWARNYSSERDPLCSCVYRLSDVACDHWTLWVEKMKGICGVSLEWREDGVKSRGLETRLKFDFDHTIIVDMNVYPVLHRTDKNEPRVKAAFRSRD